MKRKLTIVCILCLLFLTSCGNKDVGHQDVLKDVKNNTYVATETDNTNNGWVIETTSVNDVSTSIRNLMLDVPNFSYKTYIGYKVNSDNIQYAFVGLIDNTKSLVYIKQNTNNDLSYEIGNYDDLGNVIYSQQKLNDGSEE